jgi:hypothetical protein
LRKNYPWQRFWILFVSDAVSDVKAIGDRVLWLDHGRMIDVGEPDRVVSKYLAAMTEKDSTYLLRKSATDPQTRHGGLTQAPEIAETIPNIDHRFGDGRTQIIGIACLMSRAAHFPYWNPARASWCASACGSLRMWHCRLSASCCAISGMSFSGTNTAHEGYELVPLRAGDVTTVDFHLDLPELYPASFSFSPAIADGTLMGYQMCDWIDNAITLQMGRSEAQIYGYIHLPCRVEVNARIRTERQLEKQLG